MAKSSDRTRLWCAVIYPESAPKNWRDILDDYHIEWAESPLHEFDINEGTGEVKKAHWHIVLSFDGPKSFEQVKSILEPLNCPIPIKCHSLKGAVRYFIHLDNPDKYQYSRSSIIAHGGFDVDSALAPSSSARYSLISDMMEYCSENGIIEFFDLVEASRIHHFDDWFPILCDSGAIIMREYLKSKRYSSKES